MNSAMNYLLALYITISPGASEKPSLTFYNNFQTSTTQDQDISNLLTEELAKNSTLYNSLLTNGKVSFRYEGYQFHLRKLMQTKDFKPGDDIRYMANVENGSNNRTSGTGYLAKNASQKDVYDDMVHK